MFNCDIPPIKCLFGLPCVMIALPRCTDLHFIHNSDLHKLLEMEQSNERDFLNVVFVYQANLSTAFVFAVYVLHLDVALVSIILPMDCKNTFCKTTNFWNIGF